MLRTFRYPLSPTAAQATVLEQWRVACRQLYNGALQERRDAWQRAKVSIGYNDQTKSLTELRKEEEWKAIPVEVERSALSRIDKSFKAFFRRVKAGEKAGFPRFKSRDRYGSIGLGRVKVTDGVVHVPKLGPVRFHQYRELRGTIKNVEVTRNAKGWSVCIACDIGAAPAKVEPGTSIGIDLGLTSLVVLSNGEAVEAPKFFRRAQRRLAHLQRGMARCKRRSKRRTKARVRVALAHLRIKNQRLDFARKLAANLFARFDLIAHEDLNMRGLAKGLHSKSVHDAAWSLLLQCLAYKAEEAGKHVIGVDPRGTTQECSSCGTVVPKDLKDRWHKCGCGCSLSRDHNAAINVHTRGLRVIARGGRSAPSETRSPNYWARPYKASNGKQAR